MQGKRQVRQNHYIHPLNKTSYRCFIMSGASAFASITNTCHNHSLKAQNQSSNQSPYQTWFQTGFHEQVLKKIHEIIKIFMKLIIFKIPNH